MNSSPLCVLSSHALSRIIKSVVTGQAPGIVYQASGGAAADTADSGGDCNGTSVKTSSDKQQTARRSIDASIDQHYPATFDKIAQPSSEASTGGQPHFQEQRPPSNISSFRSSADTRSTLVRV